MQEHDSFPVNTRALEVGAVPRAAYRVEEVREIDRILIEERGIPGLTLMKRAAEASEHLLLDLWPDTRTVRVYCGSGNNAADGYIVAGLLAERRIEVEVVQVGDTTKLGADGQSALAFCQRTTARIIDQGAQTSVPDVMVDALLGTGFRGSLRDEYRVAIEEINHSGLPVLSIDIPSGVNLSLSKVETAVVATATVSYIALKQGLLTGEALNYVGQHFFAPLADSFDIAKKMPSVPLLSLPELRQALPARVKDAHKFRFGHVLVIGGGQGMGGASLMTALAAMRAGAGLVSLGTHPEHSAQLVGLHPEIMIRGVSDSSALAPLLESASAIAIGPGLSTTEWGQEMLAAALATDLPMVVDADGLNLLAGKGVQRDNWILTPHPGEAKRLLADEITDRFEAANNLQAKYGGVAVLKGAGTLIASSDQTSLCPYGNPGMSTAGMGDVLCGVIAGVLGQCQDLELAAKLGVVLHSAAADALVEKFGERGLLATDLIPEVRRLVNGR